MQARRASGVAHRVARALAWCVAWLLAAPTGIAVAAQPSAVPRRIVGLRLVAAGAIPEGWVREQLALANDRFADVGIGFRLLGRTALPVEFEQLDSAQARDEVGRTAFARGEILWIAPLRLVDLDGHGKRRGVHWRDRSDRRGEDDRRRWVIVSGEAFPLVLAHELGHFFGLPHGHERTSFMNKRDGADRPPWSRRRLTPRERRRVLARAAAMLRNGRLRRLQAVN